MPCVVVDTTTTYDDPRLTSIKWMQVLGLCAKNQIRLAVPHPVLLESVRHYRRQAEQSVKSVQAELKKLKTTFGIEGGEGPALDVVDVKAHEAYLSSRLAGVGASLLALPLGASPLKLLTRDIEGRRPFQKSGKGFRDALNWETILQLIEDEPTLKPIYWVTKNSSDFSDGKGGLHSDLVEELTDPSHVVLVPTLEDFLKNPQIAPLLAGLSAGDSELAKYITSAAEDEEIEPFNTHDYVCAALVEASEGLVGETIEGAHSSWDSTGPFADFDLPSSIEDITVTYVQADPGTVDWHVYESFDETTLLVEASIQASLSFEGFVSKADALHPEGFEVSDWDWNDHYSHVSFERDATLKFQLRVEEGVGVEHWDFESAE